MNDHFKNKLPMCIFWREKRKNSLIKFKKANQKKIHPIENQYSNMNALCIMEGSYDTIDTIPQ